MFENAGRRIGRGVRVRMAVTPTNVVLSTNTGLVISPVWGDDQCRVLMDEPVLVTSRKERNYGSRQRIVTSKVGYLRRIGQWSENEVEGAIARAVPDLNASHNFPKHAVVSREGVVWHDA